MAFDPNYRVDNHPQFWVNHDPKNIIPSAYELTPKQKKYYSDTMDAFVAATASKEEQRINAELDELLGPASPVTSNSSNDQAALTEIFAQNAYGNAHETAQTHGPENWIQF